MADISKRALTAFIAIIAMAFLGGLTTAAFRVNNSSADTTHSGPSAQAERDENREWLNGRWELAYSRGNAPKDMLVFDEQRNVMIITPDGRSIHGRYFIRKDEIVMMVEVGSKKVIVKLNIPDDRKRLESFDNAGVLDGYYTKR